MLRNFSKGRTPMNGRHSLTLVNDFPPTVLPDESDNHNNAKILHVILLCMSVFLLKSDAQSFMRSGTLKYKVQKLHFTSMIGQYI